MISGIGPYLPEAAGLAGLAATLAIAAAFIGLGLLLGGGGRNVEALLLSGWGLAAAVVTVVGTTMAAAIGWLLFPLLALGIIAVAVRLRRGSFPVVEDAGRLGVVTLPLLLVVSAAAASQWDEFAHWLLNQRYLVDVGMFPRRGLPESTSGFAAYPYGLALAGFGISRLVGSFVENAGALINTLLIPLLGIAAVRVFRAGASTPDRPVSWTEAALAVAAGTLLNPTFVPKLVFTTYADWTTAAVLGVATVMAWQIIERLAVEERAQAIAGALPLGFVLALAISLKQPNVVLVVLFLIGMTFVIALGPKLRIADWARLGFRLALPGIVVYLAWRHHVAHHIAGREFAFMPFEGWLWDDLGSILGRMLLIASKKGGYFGVMTLASGVTMYALVCRLAGKPMTPEGRLAVLVSAVFLGFNAFLYVAYVGAFGRGEGQNAASYWRYNTQLGGMALVFGAAMLGMLYRRLTWRLPASGWIPVGLIVSILIVPPALASKIRFDLNPVTRYVRSVGADMAQRLPVGATLVVVDPSDNGKRAMLLRYELAGRARVDRWSGGAVTDPVTLSRSLAGLSSVYLWVHVPIESLSQALGIDLAPLSSYLVEPMGAGWRVARSWAYPGYVDPVAEDD